MASKTSSYYVNKVERGNVVIREEPTSSGKTRIRTYCQRRQIPQDMRIVKHPDWPTAEAFAGRLNALLAHDAHLSNESSTTARSSITQSLQTLNGLNLKRAIPLEAVPVIEAGFAFLDALEKVNEARQKVNLKPFVALTEIDNWKEAQLKLTTPEAIKTFGDFSQAFIDYKTSAHGGKGNKKLETDSTAEIKRMVDSYIVPIIGKLPLATNALILRETMIKGLNEAVSKSGKNKGKPIESQTKKNIAVKASQYCEWIRLKKGLLQSNPLQGLAGEFERDSSKKVITLTVDETRKLFTIASKHPKYKKLIPYLSLLFFTGMRAEEIADYHNSERRFNWSQFQEWKHQGNSGGFLALVETFEEKEDERLRRSKSSYDRHAELTPNGLQWLNWYFDNKLPEKGQVFFSRKYWDKLKTEAGIASKMSEQSVARHTFFSSARRNPDFNKMDDTYWCNRAGHTIEIFRSHYSFPVVPSDAKAYFSIVPPDFEDTKRKEWETLYKDAGMSYEEFLKEYDRLMG